MKCNVAIIGAGYTAREHLKAFSDIPGVKIVGIFSRTRSKAEALAQEYKITYVCSSVSELYEKTRADLIVVTVNELSMKSICSDCFKFPWVSLLEKPAGFNCMEAEEILTMAREKNRKVYVALNRRFYSSTRTMVMDLINMEGDRFIRVQDQEDQHAAIEAGQPKVVVDNWMYANSIHLIDYFRILGRGKITKVSPVIHWNPDHPGNVIATIHYDSGDVGLYEGIWNAPSPWVVNVISPKKRWELRPIEQANFQNYGERKITPVEPDPIDQEFKPGFRLQAEMAVKATLGMDSEAVLLEDATETMKLIKLIYNLDK